LQQLTSLDAQFLALESARQTGHVGGLAVLDPSTAPGGKLDGSDLQALLAERIPLLPPLRRKLTEVPLGLDYPYWVDDEDFDLDFHVREIALPSPGDDEQLAEQVARIISRPLDRSRPLWELYLIHGLESGCVAMLSKIHHAVVDGMSGAEIMGLLLDLSPEGRELPPAPDDRVGRRPSELEMLGRGLLGVPRYPLRLLRSMPSAIPNADAAPAIFGAIPGATTLGRMVAGVQAALTGDGLAADFLKRPTPPRTSFNGRISAHRRFAFGQLPLEEVKAVKNQHEGVTVNDVVVSICASAVRRWLIAHDELPDTPLVAQIPVSVRGEGEFGTFGNRILLMSAPLFTDIEDPIERLHKTHEALKVMKTRHRALPADLLQDANHFIPPAVFSRAARLTFRLASGLANPTWNLVISNVPGPQFPLYLAGAKLVANYPVSVITDGMGLNITLMSYNGHMDIGIVADRDQMPDLWEMVHWMREGLDELKLEPKPRRKPQRRRGA
jgi:WS/DGAT/MGAT family acyltransferase